MYLSISPISALLPWLLPLINPLLILALLVLLPYLVHVYCAPLFSLAPAPHYCPCSQCCTPQPDADSDEDEHEDEDEISAP